MIFSIFARRSSPIIGLADTCLTGELTFGSDADASSPVTFCFCPWERCCPHELEATFSAAAMALDAEKCWLRRVAVALAQGRGLESCGRSRLPLSRRAAASAVSSEI